MKLHTNYNASTIGGYIHWVPIFVWAPVNGKQCCTGDMGAYFVWVLIIIF